MNMNGHLDLCGYPLIEGWLYCDAFSDQPIVLQVYIGETLIGECVADRFRKDLQEAGFGSGHCGFSFDVTEEFLSASFSETRLRFVNAPVYLVPDQFTTIVASKNLALSLTEKIAPIEEKSILITLANHSFSGNKLKTELVS